MDGFRAEPFCTQLQAIGNATLTLLRAMAAPTSIELSRNLVSG